MLSLPKSSKHTVMSKRNRLNDAAREELNRERAQIRSRPDYLERDVLVARVTAIDNLLHFFLESYVVVSS